MRWDERKEGCYDVIVIVLAVPQNVSAFSRRTKLSAEIRDCKWHCAHVQSGSSSKRQRKRGLYGNSDTEYKETRRARSGTYCKHRLCTLTMREDLVSGRGAIVVSVQSVLTSPYNARSKANVQVQMSARRRIRKATLAL